MHDDLHAEGLRYHEDIAKNDGCIEIVASDRLQCGL